MEPQLSNEVLAAVIGAVGTLVSTLLSVVIGLVLSTKSKVHKIEIDTSVMKRDIHEALQLKDDVRDNRENIIVLKEQTRADREQNAKDKRAFFDKIRAIESNH